MVQTFLLLIGFQVLVGIFFTKIASYTNQSGWADPAILLWTISIIGAIFFHRKKHPWWQLSLFFLTSPFISFLLYEIIGVLVFGWLGGR